MKHVLLAIRVHDSCVESMGQLYDCNSISPPISIPSTTTPKLVALSPYKIWSPLRLENLQWGHTEFSSVVSMLARGTPLCPNVLG